MVLKEAFDVVHVEIASIEQRGAQELPLRFGSELSFQPLAHRSAKTHLLAIDDLLGDQPFNRLLQ